VSVLSAIVRFADTLHSLFRRLHVQALLLSRCEFDVLDIGYPAVHEASHRLLGEAGLPRQMHKRAFVTTLRLVRRVTSQHSARVGQHPLPGTG
jgi:hypothetical protein